MTTMFVDALRLANGMVPAVIVKVTLVLLAGSVAALLLRRQAAAVRHYAWLLTLAGTLVVAIPTPSWWRIEVPVASWTKPDATVTTVATEPTPAVTLSPIDPTSTAATSPSNVSDHPTAPRLSLGLLWLIGAVLVLGWHLLGHWGIARLANAATPVRDPQWRALVPETIALRASDAVGSPLVCGILRPTILLPHEASEWTGERRQVVALHELAHVARRDPLSQLLATLACAVWWFHPGAWLAARRLRAESERACDDRVMAAGVPAPDYASHLLGVARSARALRLAGAVAITMARRSTLEGRLLAMLDSRRRTGSVPRAGRVRGAIACTALLATIAIVRPVARVASADAQMPAPATATAAAVVPDAKPAPPSELLAANHSKSASSDEQGSPFRDQVEASPGDTLVLDLETGGSVTIRGWDQNRVEVNGMLAGNDWEQTRTELDRKGRRVTFRSVPDEDADGSIFSTSHRFDFRVPRRFNVRLHSAGGKVTITDLEGTMTGSSGGGGFVLERLKGHARLNTGGGPVTVNDVDMSGRVSTGGGAVRLSNIRGGLRGSSGSGPVVQVDPDVESDPDGPSGDLDDVQIDASDIHVGNSTTGRLRVNKAGGAIRIDQAPEGVHATTGGGKVVIGPSAKNVELSTGGGDMDIGPAKGSVSAGTGAGDVHLVLAKSNERNRTVTVWSGKGTIVLELARDLGVTLDLEAAYTDGFNRKSTIRSEVPVDIHVSDDWDMTQGTPRKYVRAEATHGDGSVRVKLRTVNGDIIIKRPGVDFIDYPRSLYR